MNEIKQITSLQNPLVKKIGLLREKSKERKKSGLFVLEGLLELGLAIKGGYVIENLLFSADLISERELNEILKPYPKTVEMIQVSKEVYRKIAYRESTEGVVALGQSKPHHLDGLELPEKNPFVLVAEAPEKPGNIGALLRTADAAGLDAVIIADPKTDLYNPNIVRSSVGGLFTNAIATGSSSEIIQYLTKKGIKIYAAALSASKPYTSIDFTGATAIVMGTEATGLSDAWLTGSDQNIIIPMNGEIDSMNVSVSAAILIFEGKRQREKQV
ncbi:TrmH family RNA methyltransferase [Maribacter sp. 2-571]|uniref:TrmH family RNA methyltransferase n=1 Tax=Maribacter sp. 2-571 TaxID=3417569 RepID=UPI003D355105